RVERDRLLRGELKIELEMVLEILADAGQVVQGRDAMGGELLARPDAGQLQELRIVDRAGREDHLAPRHHSSRLTALAIFDADGLVSLEQDAGRERMGLDRQV